MRTSRVWTHGTRGAEFKSRRTEELMRPKTSSTRFISAMGPGNHTAPGSLAHGAGARQTPTNTFSWAKKLQCERLLTCWREPKEVSCLRAYGQTDPEKKLLWDFSFRLPDLSISMPMFEDISSGQWQDQRKRTRSLHLRICSRGAGRGRSRCISAISAPSSAHHAVQPVERKEPSSISAACTIARYARSGTR